ncbi:class I SAM-dependent methyltransferase [Blastopirellula marina]|nr:class I SAM-dependent methyltransferase [Blastopirellula marina]
MNLTYWVRHPWQAGQRIRYLIWQRRNPNAPWLCPGTIAFCEKHIHDSMTVLEFGCGRSTHWFSQLAETVVSIEYDADWYRHVGEQLRLARKSNVDLRLTPLNHPLEVAEQPDYDPVPDYVGILDSFPAESLDVVLVDGHYRTICARRAAVKIAPGGFLIIDDLQRWPDWAHLTIPEDWELVDHSSNGVKSAGIWQRPH